MTKIIVMKGLPASGKSVWSKELIEKDGTYKRVSKDDLRAMLDNNKWGGNKEKFIIKTRNELIRLFLKNGFNPIIDDTNLNPKHLETFYLIAKEFNAEVEVIDFTTVPLEVCLERDAKRPNPVGRGIILKMYNDYLKPKYEWNPDLPSCLICDLDGTLADFGNKNPYDRDFENDILIHPVRELINKFIISKTVDIGFLFSGRSEKFRDVTGDWLFRNNMKYYSLTMRKEDDNRDDVTVKKEMYENLIKNQYNVFCVIDDRPKIVRFWKSLGLFVFDVNQSGVDF